MPGILGIIGRSPVSFKEPLEQMLKTTLHEPFYTSGSYINEGLKIGMGWTSHQNSFSDCLPAWNETRDIGLVFCGATFENPAAIAALRTRGHAFSSQDTSYLVHLYEEEGECFLDKLNGCFSGVLIDLRLAKVILFNDRYGLNRIYIHENADGLYFASEAKAILKVLPGLRELNSRSLAERFSCGCVLQNRTLFPGISLLPAGSSWIFLKEQNPVKKIYFEPASWENQEPLSAPEYYEELKETFGYVLPKYCGSDHRLAISLTGGLDSRMIMAESAYAADTLPCYTFGGSYRDCTDVTMARRVAKTCNQPHQIIPVDGDFHSLFPSLAGKAVYLSDGTMDVAGSVELYVNQIARKIAPVRLTGNYGSEILRGSIAFNHKARNLDLYEPEFAQLLLEAGETYNEELQGNPLSFIAFKQVPWYHHSRFSLEQSQLTIHAPFLDNDLVRLAYRAPNESVASKDTCMRLIHDANPALARIPTDRGISYLQIPILSTARHLFQEFTVKAEYAYDVGMPHWLAKIDRSSPIRLEKLFLGRHKFYHFRIWYRNQLSGYLKEILLDPKARRRSYLRGDRLEKLVNGHIKGDGNYTAELHQALTFELIHQQLID